jgi:hypothetical protein
MRMQIVMEEHCSGHQHSMPFVVNSQPFGPMLHEFQHEHSFPVPENACRADVCLNFIWIIWIIWIDVCIHHFLLFFGFSIHE